MNQGTVSIVKHDLAIYIINFFILGQSIPAQNSPKDIRAYKCQQNETKLVVLLYNMHTGKFLGLDLRLPYTVLRGYPDEVFFNYSFNVKTSKVLFSSSKDKTPTAFTCTAFKNQLNAIVDDRYAKKCWIFSFTYLLRQIESSPSISVKKLSL